MTTRVEIQQFDGSRGLAIDGSGRRLGFYERACAGVVPKVGESAWAVLVVSIEGEPEIVLLRPTPDARESDVLLARTNAQEALRLSYFDRDGNPKGTAKTVRAPLDVVRPYLDVPPELEELLAPTTRERLAESIAGLEFSSGLTLNDFWPATSVDTGVAFDPCFVPLGGADGDLIGLYVYPPALNEAPIALAFAFHEQDPSFTWVAESVAHFQAMLADRTNGKAPKPGTEPGKRNPLVIAAMKAVDKKPTMGKGIERERWLVWKIQSCGGVADAGEALVRELRALYEQLGWRAALAMLDEYIAIATVEQDAIGGWERRLAAVQGELAEAASTVTVVKAMPTIPPTLLAKLLAGRDVAAQRRMVSERLPTGTIGTMEKRAGGWLVVDEGRELTCVGATFNGFEPTPGDRVLATDHGGTTSLFLISRP